MNKSIMLVILMSVFLSACGSNSSWEKEEVSVVSDRIMADNVEAVWTLEQDQASAASTFIRLKINKEDGKPIEEFDVNHEKLLHLIVISKDLAYFHHIHPEYKGNGVFEISNDFPSGGEYKLIADFKPTGGDAMTKMEWVRVEGSPAEPVPVVPDADLDKVFEGKRVKLTIDNLEAKKDTTLTFAFKDEKTGEPITDLEPYLGAIGHVVVLSEDGNRYIHVHADDDQGSGPEASFETEFPKSGIYKIWGQFQKDNKVFTVSYVVNVK
ncbi:hypothetical protein D7Z26_18675 [Cohnella endophytica]|uniref:YtkA-like domain-containing protein n=1 Tax=Cohnella endophytica TaxID=2419778 RepID=A0A494XGI6_9BACL|nr:hypothetical protein [Cohnella endophytica]RKP49857.1 hypothetical protein D7Z26_18675 [Cohnella endophytica]